MKILIVSVNALGDTYLSAAAIAPLRSRFGASCRITLVVNARSRELAEHLDVDGVVELHSASPRDILRCWALLVRMRYDYVFSFFPGRINTFFLMSVRADRRAGYRNIRLIREWWHDTPQKVYAASAQASERSWSSAMTYLDRVSVCLSACGIDAPSLVKPHLTNLPPLAPSGDIPSVLIHPRSSGMSRSIGPDAVRAIVEVLCTASACRLGLIGWGNDLQVLRHAIGRNDRVDYLENLALVPLMARLQQSRLFIGVDSFPLHLADAYGLKYIGIFGPTHPDAFQACRHRMEFGCNDLSTIDAGTMRQKFKPLLHSLTY